MPKMIGDSTIVNAMLSAIFSSIFGSLLLLMYLSWEKRGTSSFDMLSLTFTYFFVAITSLTGTIMGSLLICVPIMIVSERLYPNASIKGTIFIVFSVLFIWLVVLAWPVTRIFGASYSDIFLLSPFAFCSAAALAYLVYWK